MRLIQTATDGGTTLPEPENSWRMLQNKRKRSRSSTSTGQRVDRAASLAKSRRDENKLGDEFEDDGHYKANFKSVHRQTVFHLDQVGRREPNAALDWWRAIENSAVIDLRKQKLYLAPLFLEAARAFFVYPGIVGVLRASLW